MHKNLGELCLKSHLPGWVIWKRQLQFNLICKYILQLGHIQEGSLLGEIPNDRTKEQCPHFPSELV